MPYVFHKSIPAIIILLSLTNCKSNNNISQEKKEKPGQKAVLVLGKGGGFTGAYTEYIIYSSGEVFKQNPEQPSEKEKVKTLGEEEAGELFERADELGFPEPEFNHPGNMTTYIHYQKGESEKKITWGSNQKAPPVSFKEFYANAMKKIRE